MVFDMTHATPPTTGARVRGALATAGIRQVDAAAAIDISQSELSRRISGLRPWRDGELLTLAELCGVSPSLFGVRSRRRRKAAAVAA